MASSRYYQKTTLPNGLRVVTEAIPTVRSAAVGIWIGTGSCMERPHELGISHLIEHMMFKGTHTRSARQIFQEIEAIGGAINAFTSRELTCYYAHVRDRDLPLAIDVLTDMLTNSLMDPEALAREKRVIAEEIRMYDDQLDSLVFDQFLSHLWPDHPLGRPITGTVDSVMAISREQVLRYMAKHYTPDNIVIAAAGNIEHDDLVLAAQERMGVLSGHLAQASPLSLPDLLTSQAVLRRRPGEQAHLMVGGRGLPIDHPDGWPLRIANIILGGGSGSRLFHEIRERRGLAYAVGADEQAFRRSGSYGIYVATSPESVEEVTAIISRELDRASQEGFSAEEVSRAKSQASGEMVLGLESVQARMSRLARGELTRGYARSVDESLSMIAAVTTDQVNRVAQEHFSAPRLLSLVTPGEVSGFQAHRFQSITVI